MICPICGAAHAGLDRLLHDDRYGYPGLFQLFKCCRCDHRWLNVSFTQEQISDLYTAYYPRKNLAIAKRQVRTMSRVAFWLRGMASSVIYKVPGNVRVLDIGCGMCESLAYYEAKACDAYGVEADGNVGAGAAAQNYKVRIGLFDSSAYEAGFFDFVTLNQVIEHAINPIGMLRDVSAVLKPGGKAVISTPNAGGWGARVFGNRWINWHAPYHLHFFSANSWEAAIKAAGFELLERETITSSSWLGYQWRHLATYNKAPGNESSFWTYTKSAGNARINWLRVFGLFDYIGINVAVTRFFDWLELGDNYVYVVQKSD